MSDLCPAFGHLVGHHSISKKGAEMTKQTDENTQAELSQNFDGFMDGVSQKIDAVVRMALTKEGQAEIKKGRITRAKTLKKIRESIQD